MRCGTEAYALMLILSLGRYIFGEKKQRQRTTIYEFGRREKKQQLPSVEHLEIKLRLKRYGEGKTGVRTTPRDDGGGPPRVVMANGDKLDTLPGKL
jgi:hypothetical protein